MKKILNKLIRNEEGQAMILALILLAVGGLIIAPLLSYMSTGLKVGQVYEENMAELYAADAGVEDGIWRIQNDVSLPLDVGDIVTYPITGGVNNKAVNVTITKENDVEIFLEDLLNEHFSGVHSGWMQVTHGLLPDGTYTITVTDLNSNNKKIDTVGAWIEGTYDIVGTASISGINGPYMPPTFNQRPFEGGTAFTWSWAGPNRPVFNVGDWMTLEFHIDPAEVTGLHFSFASLGSSDIGVVYPATTFAIYKVTATADSTADSTEVVSYIAWMETFPVRVLTWEINPQ